MRTSIHKMFSFILLVIFSILLTSCKKFLDKKSNQALSIPATVQDVQMLLDDWVSVSGRDPYAGVASADEFYMQEAQWLTLTQYDRDMYSWQPRNLFNPGTGNDWANCYNTIYKANTALFYLPGFKGAGTDAAWNNAKGHALFLRAKMYFHLASLFAVAYDSTTAASDLAVPLRLDPDFNKPSERASVQQTFDRILQDLKEAAGLLPATAHPLKPTKPAVYGMLARVNLYMRKYKHAYLYADSALSYTSTLLNYNAPVPGFFDPAASHPFAQFNPEVIFSCSIGYPSQLYFGYVDSLLYHSYADDDLRKTLFHKTTQVEIFKGNYEGRNNLFDGIATDELILIRAECAARQGFREQAMDDLNRLLQNRYKTGTFTPLQPATAEEAVALILDERKKELVFRGLRWLDIKRLNKEGANITLTRKIGSTTYLLAPNDLRYALPLPKDVLELSGMPDNPR